MTLHLSDLDHALLGLLARGPATGYDLRKVFQSTALGSYSDSPGSIYPALARLEHHKHIKAQVERTGRKRRTLNLTPHGSAALRKWVVAPITSDQVAHQRGAIALRLAFLSDIAPDQLRPFLRQYFDALRERIAALVADTEEQGPALSASGQLALMLGLETFRAQAEWCRQALARGGES
jgi:DNA-binding PadR family transcriptional regulator